MTIFNRVATTALTGLAALGFASASYATPTRTVPQEGSIEAHALLADTIRRAGVTFLINHAYCQENPSVNGFYAGTERVLVVCNDDYSATNTDPAWTANDFDTLRHEAQHLIQDCMAGTNHDHHLGSLYKDPVALGYSVLGSARIDNITQIYRENGASDHVLRMEYEAFAVAHMNVPLEQSQDMVRACGL